MSVSVVYDEQNHIILGKITGSTDRKTLRQYLRETRQIIIDTKANLILSDYRDAVFSFSMVDVFQIPEKHHELASSLDLNLHGIKRALIFAKNMKDLALFFENVAVNRGQKVKVFEDEAPAIRWLLDQSETAD